MLVLLWELYQIKYKTRCLPTTALNWVESPKIVRVNLGILPSMFQHWIEFVQKLILLQKYCFFNILLKHSLLVLLSQLYQITFMFFYSRNIALNWVESRKIILVFMCILKWKWCQVNTVPVTIFTMFHFHQNLQMGPISYSVS